MGNNNSSDKIKDFFNKDVKNVFGKIGDIQVLRYYSIHILVTFVLLMN